eukprot:TRINITY_DN12021_c0_g1_i1.p1 TRINITY_DN12021_c0_g1~~TRINITY_DN12021_c0_g1_i1.p1  ORF type:complete len:319 (+),score=91.26 TRINITY_DN12021_c0_g1_i1:97-1053(+)
MPSARWACSNCGLINTASANACTGCSTRCPVQDNVSWQCPSCALNNTSSICSSCQYRKPLPKEGIPQIFEGMRMVFTGIIPRSIPHSSEWKEWQIAEQRGAKPMDGLNEQMTHLIYREGYERSEKVKRALKMKGCNVKVLIADWFYQSVNLGMALDEAPYDLRAPHRQLRSAKVQDQAGDIATSYSAQIMKIGTGVPPGVPVGKQVSKALGPNGVYSWLVIPKDKNPLFASAAIGAAFSDGVPEKDRQLAAAYSAKLCKSPGDAEATHLICAPGDEGASCVAEARQHCLFIVTLEWMHNCIQCQEVLPAYGPYKVVKR